MATTWQLTEDALFNGSEITTNHNEVNKDRNFNQQRNMKGTVAVCDKINVS